MFIFRIVKMAYRKYEHKGVKIEYSFKTKGF